VQLLRRYAGFRRLWTGEVISYLGDWFNTIAIYAAVEHISDSAQAVAAIMVAKNLPVLFVTPFAGPLIDRFDRKWILIWADIVRLVCVVGLLVAHHFESFWGLLAATIVMCMCAGVVAPTKSASIPMLVEPKDVAAANAMGGGTWSVMLAIGAALGGIATAWLGVRAAFIIDGLTFLVSLVFFLRLPTLKPKQDTQDLEKNTSLADGLAYLKADRYVRVLAALKPLMAISVGVSALIPIIGRWFPGHDGADFVGYLFAARGAGALTGSMFLRMFVGDALTTIRRLVLAGFLIAAVGQAMIVFAPAYWVVVFGLFFSAIGTGAIWVNSGTLIQQEGDASYFGRVFSLEFGVTTAMVALASWVGSYAVDHGASLFDVAAASATYMLLPAAMWWVVLKRRERDEALEVSASRA
jgi:predicted MFS family arabinose efflux permease